MLSTLKALDATPAETFRTVLAAYAESDFDPYAKHPTDDTWGLFQQNPRWWGTKSQILDPVYATTSFIVGRPSLPALRKITLTSDPVVDCWRVQKWGAPNPDVDLAGFRAHPSTQNYTRRLGVVQQIVDNPGYFDGEITEEPRIMAVGGALVSRGVTLLDNLPGASPAEKLRQAWGAGNTDCIVGQHNTTIDVGTAPILWPSNACLASAGPPQTEFSANGRINFRGATSVFQVVKGSKGQALVNVGAEGTAGLRFIAQNPMDASGAVLAYASIEGCSFDNFYTVAETPMLGVHLDVRYFNNCSGPFAFKLTGSDCQLWTHGGKGDWGAGGPDAAKVALVILAGLEKSTIGQGDGTTGGLYLTCEKGAGMQVEGGSSRGGLDLFGITLEGRNASQPSQGAVYRQVGNHVNFFGGNLNFGMSNTAAQGRGDRGLADISAGVVAFHGTRFRRGSSSAPFIARRGTGVVDTFGCREVPSGATVTATNI